MSKVDVILHVPLRQYIDLLASNNQYHQFRMGFDHFLKSKISDDIKMTDSKKERMAKNKINGFYMSEFPLIAYSLSFPRSKHASTNDSVEYQVNDVYYRSMHDVREDEIGDEY